MTHPLLSPLLLATEHTAQDAGAEAVAFALARRRGAAPLAVVLPVVREGTLEMVAPAAAERADAEAGERREALQAAAAAAGVALDIALRRGPLPQAEIVDEARRRASGLIVIRRRGRRGLLARLLVGEMVSRVLDVAPCSVLVTPREARLWQRRVLAAVEPAAAPAAPAAPATPAAPVAAAAAAATLPAAAAALAQETGAALHFVCVVPAEADRAAAERALDAARRDSGRPDADTEVRIGAVAAEIVAAAEAAGADLLVVGRVRQRLGSVAHRVAGLASCPVLVHVPAVVESR